MKAQKQKALLYFITVTIVITIGIQAYWNVNNYNSNKQRLINEVQISLDNSVETYYSDLAKNDVLSFVEVRNESDSTKVGSRMVQFLDEINLGDVTKRIDSSLKQDNSSQFKENTTFIDSTGRFLFAQKKIEGVTVIRGQKSLDSLESISSLINKITISFTNDSLNFKRLDTLLKKELERKKIALSYGLNHFKGDSIEQRFNTEDDKEHTLSTFSKSTYLPRNQKLELRYSNPTLSILKRSLTGISLSLLLSISIISCLFYLLYVIKKQKELAEIKNDLISNITHEFKTPIATVSTAIEGIKNFNEDNDRAKTEKYLNISDQQLKKLHLMVEKLLETATLDSDKLILDKEDTDLVVLLKNMVAKYQMLAPEKNIVFKSNSNARMAKVDPFHFENVLANLVDNAIKYGGNNIAVNLNAVLTSTEIVVADNGGAIEKNQGEKIFDKFYRVPTGNRHDVKGFGIGLFYAKKIIEKHGGQLQLVPDANDTVFKIII